VLSQSLRAKLCLPLPPPPRSLRACDCPRSCRSVAPPAVAWVPPPPPRVVPRARVRAQAAPPQEVLQGTWLLPARPPVGWRCVPPPPPNTRNGPAPPAICLAQDSQLWGAHQRVGSTAHSPLLACAGLCTTALLRAVHVLCVIASCMGVCVVCAVCVPVCAEHCVGCRSAPRTSARPRSFRTRAWPRPCFGCLRTGLLRACSSTHA
jgi:hypothetical protein